VTDNLAVIDPVKRRDVGSKVTFVAIPIADVLLAVWLTGNTVPKDLPVGEIGAQMLVARGTAA